MKLLTRAQTSTGLEKGRESEMIEGNACTAHAGEEGEGVNRAGRSRMDSDDCIVSEGVWFMRKLKKMTTL